MEQQQQPTTSKRILLIEDDLSICEIYHYTLSGAGYDLTIANDGETGLKYIQDNPYDLVLLDIMLPKITGVEIVKRVFTADFPRKNVRIILLSNLAQESIIEQALKDGAEEFILKSKILPKELVDTIANALDDTSK